MDENKQKYVSCKWINSGLEFRHDSLRTCCVAFFQGKDAYKSVMIENYHGEAIDWDKIFEHKNFRKNLQKNNQPFLSCEKCIFLQELKWDEENYIDTILFNNFIRCNSNCVYCGTTNDKNTYKEEQAYNVFPVLKEMADKGILKATPNSLIDFGGGEVSILGEFKDIFELLTAQGFKNFTINSSGIKYSDVIEKGLKMGVINLVISPDSGTKEIYEKIKRVPCFDAVYNNIKKYTSVLSPENKHLLKVKFIIIPGYNDSVNEIDAWLKKCKKIGIKKVLLDLEFAYYFKNKDNMSPHIHLLIEYAKNVAKKLGIELELFASIQFLLTYEQGKKYNFSNFVVKSKLFAGLEVNKLKNKVLEKNIKYETYFENL